jgi:hypothetical protein
MLGLTDSAVALKYTDDQNSSQAPTYRVPVLPQVRVASPKLFAPLVLSVEHMHDRILVSDELLRVYGVGDDLDSAVTDLLEMLADYHAELSESKRKQEQLSSHLLMQLRILDYYLGPSC